MRPTFRTHSVSSSSRLVPWTILALAVLLVVGCQPKSPEEQVADARSRYVVELNSWFPKETDVDVSGEIPGDMGPEDSAAQEAVAEAALEETGEVADLPPVEGESAEDEEGATEGAEGEETMEPIGPEERTIFFDLIVQLDGDRSLPGITLDLTQADASGAEKKAWKRYVELPKMIKGQTQQVSFEEELEFEEGDQFSVELRTPVPPAERGEYRELAEAASE